MEIDKITTEFSITFESLDISMKDVIEYLEWLAENKDGVERCHMHWHPPSSVKSDVVFKEETIAMAFKLRWL